MSMKNPYWTIVPISQYGTLLARKWVKLPRPPQTKSTTQVPEQRLHSRFKAIPNGVLKRLANLSSANPETENKRLNELYPQHALALEKAQLTSASSDYQTLKESLEEIQIQNQNATNSANNTHTENSTAAETKRQRDKARTTWFCIGYSKIWGMPISARLQRLREKYKLSWLRNAMSYRRFENLGQKFNSDLSGKVMNGIIDSDLMDMTSIATKPQLWRMENACMTVNADKAW